MEPDRAHSSPVAWALKAAKAADDLLLAIWPGLRGILATLVVGTVFLAFDRAPPFAVLLPDYPPPVVAPGGAVVLRANVRRDIDRNCAATMYRRMHFAEGRRELPTEYFSAAEIAIQEVRTPGRMAPAIDIPGWAPEGRGDLIATLHYRCGSNPWHMIWPIEVVTTMPFIVQRPPA
jgi:hypothetical protein